MSDYKEPLNYYEEMTKYFVYRTYYEGDENGDPLMIESLAGICDSQEHAEQYINGMKLDDERKRQVVRDKGGHLVGERLQWLETYYKVETHKILSMKVETTES